MTFENRIRKVYSHSKASLRIDGLQSLNMAVDFEGWPDFRCDTCQDIFSSQEQKRDSIDLLFFEFIRDFRIPDETDKGFHVLQ